jgi:hypothetical protein
MKNFFLIVLFSIFLNSCGYNSIYSENQNINFTISSLELNGDSEMNNLVERKLKKYLGKDSEKKFKIKIDTNYIKKPISKDKTGKIKNYKLIAYLNLEFEIENQIKTLSLSETFMMESYTDKFEENKREKQVKNNLTNIMLNKVTTYFANYK